MCCLASLFWVSKTGAKFAHMLTNLDLFALLEPACKLVAQKIIDAL